jgi:Chaperone of endosialidase/Collagen triple helix repeat (20 copies)
MKIFNVFGAQYSRLRTIAGVGLAAVSVVSSSAFLAFVIVSQQANLVDSNNSGVTQLGDASFQPNTISYVDGAVDLPSGSSIYLGDLPDSTVLKGYNISSNKVSLKADGSLTVGELKAFLDANPQLSSSLVPIIASIGEQIYKNYPQNVIGVETLAGAQGPQGIQGIKGDKGDTGAKGENGLQGVQGVAGANGNSFNPSDVLNLANSLITNGIAYFNNNIVQNGAGSFTSGSGNVTFNGATNVSGGNSFSVGLGPTFLGGALQVNGSTSLNSLVTSGNLSVAGTQSLAGNFTQSGSSTFTTGSGAVNLGGNTNVAGNLAVNGTTLLTGNTITNGLATFDSGAIVRSGNQVKFNNSTNTFSTSLRAGANIANLSLTLPIADGTVGQVISTDGLGNLSFISAALDTNLGNSNQVLTANRSVTLGAFNLNFTGTGNITFANNTTLGAGVTISNFNTAGIVKNNASGILSSSLINNSDISNSTIDLTTKVTGLLPIANGGTGSATQNFVDLTTNQTIGGNKTFSGTLTQSGASTLAAITTTGNFSQTGASTLSTGTGAVSLNGATTLASTLTVAGNTILNNLTNNGTFTQTGNATLGGTLTVTGATSLSTLATSGPATLNSLTVTNNTSVGGNLAITGSTTTNGITNTGTISQTGASTFIGSINQTGANTFSTGTGAVSLNGNTTVSGTNTFDVGTGATTLGGTLAVTGATSLSTLATSGLATLNSLSTTNNAVIGGNISVTGTTTLSGAATLTVAPTISAFTTAGVIKNNASGLLSSSLVTNSDITNGTIDLTTKVTGILPIANGGTGSATQNFVDLTTAQSIAGNKTFSGNLIQSGAGTITTGTGAITLNGNTAVTGANNLTIGTGAFTTNGSATFQTAVATDDQINIVPFVGGSNRFAANITSADLTAARTFTLPNSSGTLLVTGNNPLSSLTAATASNTLANTNFAQTWNWNTATTENVFNLEATGLTTGSLLNLSTTNTAQTGTALYINSLSSSATTNGLIRFEFGGNYSNNGFQIDSATTTGTVQKINPSVLTTGDGLNISTSTLTTGNALRINDTSSANTALALSVKGAVAYNRGSDYTVVGTQNNINFGNTSVVRFTGSSSQHITGITGGSDGELLYILNVGANVATLRNNDPGSLVGNRIITGTGTTVTLPISAGVTLMYDSSSAAWRVVGGPTTTSISSLLAAEKSAVIDNLNWGQTWNWSTATTQTGLALTSNALTSGSILALSSTNSTTTGALLNVTSSSAAATSNGLVRFNFTGDYTGDGFKIGSSTTGGIAQKISANTIDTGVGLQILTDGLTTGSGLKVNTASTALTGDVVSITASGDNAANTGALLNVIDNGTVNNLKLATLISSSTTTTNSQLLLATSTVASPTNGIARFQFGGNRTTAGNGFQIDDISTTLATTFAIKSNSLTTGFAQTISTNSLTTGNALKVSTSSNGLTGDLVSYSSTGNNIANTGNLLKLAVNGASSAVVPLNLTNSGTGDTVIFNDDGTFTDSTPFIVSNNGNVGIGTNIASDKLTINGSGITSTNVFSINANTVTTGFVQQVNFNSLTTGSGLNLESTSTAQVGTSLYIGTASTSSVLNGLVRFDFSGDYINNGFQINTATQTGAAQRIYANSLTSGQGLFIDTSSTSFTGDLVKLESFGDNGASTGNVLKLMSTGPTSNVVAINVNNQGNGLTARFNDDGTFTDSTPFVISNDGSVGIGTATPAEKLTVNGAGIATANVAQISAQNITTGSAFNIWSPNTAQVGTALWVGTNSNQAITNGLVRFDFAGNYTNNGFQIDTATQAGIGQKINANSLTTGSAVKIELDSLTSGKGVWINANSTLQTGNLLNITATGTTGTQVAYFSNLGGSCTIVPGGTGFSCSSDSRLKKNITNVTSNVLDIIRQLQVKDFNYKAEKDTDTKHTGFIAQEVQALIPSVIHTDSETGYLSLSLDGIVPFLTKAIQELDKSLANLETRVSVLESKLSPTTSGTSIIAAGQTSIVVNYNAGNASNPKFVATPDSIINGSFAITNKTATTFTITLQNVQTTDVQFDWIVEISK